MRLWRRKREDLDARWTHEYVGPANVWALRPGPCRIIRSWAGGVIIQTPTGARYTVARSQVRRRR